MSKEQSQLDPPVSDPLTAEPSLVNPSSSAPSTAPAPKKRGRPPKKPSNVPSADNGFIALDPGDKMFSGAKPSRVLDSDDSPTRSKRQKTEEMRPSGSLDAHAVAAVSSPASDQDDGLSDYERSTLETVTAFTSALYTATSSVAAPTTATVPEDPISVPHKSFNAALGLTPAIPLPPVVQPALHGEDPASSTHVSATTAIHPLVVQPSALSTATLDAETSASATHISATPATPDPPMVVHPAAPSTATVHAEASAPSTEVSATPATSPVVVHPVALSIATIDAEASAPSTHIIATVPTPPVVLEPVPLFTATFNTEASAPSTPTAARVASSAVNASSPSTFGSTLTLSSSSKSTLNATASPSYKTFGAAVRTASSSSSPASGSKQESRSSPSPAKYRRQRDTFQVKELPAVCEVTDIDLHDDLLVNDYVSLPKLKAGRLISWSNKVGDGQLMFSSWGGMIPDMNVNFCLDALRFVQSGKYINPSRVSPLVANITRVDDIGFKNLLYVDSTPAVCVSSIVVKECHLIDPIQRQNTKRQKTIAGVFHCQEWQRLQGFFGMVFDKPNLHAQLYCDMLSFSTMPENTDNQYKSSRASRAGLYKKDKQTANRHPSDEQADPSQDPRSKIMSALTFDDNVPVYDGRFIPIDFQKDLSKLGDILPVFDGPDGIDVPPESFAVVGYTAGNYRKKNSNSWHLSLNVQWVIVLGVDPDVPMPA